MMHSTSDPLPDAGLSWVLRLKPWQLRWHAIFAAVSMLAALAFPSGQFSLAYLVGMGGFVLLQVSNMTSYQLEPKPPLREIMARSWPALLSCVGLLAMVVRSSIESGHVSALLERL